MFTVYRKTIAEILYHTHKTRRIFCGMIKMKKLFIGIIKQVCRCFWGGEHLTLGHRYDKMKSDRFLGNI